MSKDNNSVKIIVAVLFVGMLVVGFIKNGSYLAIESYAKYLMQKDYTDKEAITVDKIETDYSAGLWKQKDLINLNGFMANKLKIHGQYSKMGMYVTDEYYIVSAASRANTDYDVAQTIDLRDFLSANGINLLYVNEPAKYIDDEWFSNKFGIETYSNRNQDTFLKRINAAGIKTIDLRENILDEDLNIFKMFYRTDHHWTVPSGLWATGIIAEGLNTYFGYNIDVSVFDEDNFTRTKWRECWLGEQGRKVALTYVGLDDYTELKPKFDTSYTFIKDNGLTYEGTFDAFVNESVYNLVNDVYENQSWHYSYNRINCINHNVSEGKILIIGDSYTYVVQPFLSLQVHEVDSLILRQYKDDFKLRDYILANGYDTVIIAYSPSMIGAHSNPSSANYRMFTFDH